MRLASLPQSFTHVLSAPLEFTEAEPLWTEEAKLGTIPEPLFDFYRAASFFNPSRTPPFLDAPNPQLFAFMRAVTGSLLESLRDARTTAEEIKALRSREWASRGSKPFPEDGRIVREENRAFRALLIFLSGALDQVAEVTAVILFKGVAGLSPGRAQFQRMLDAVNAAPSTRAGIIAPVDDFTDRLVAALRAEIVVTTVEKDWIEVLLLYRNKLAHLGPRMLVRRGLHDEEGRFYYFLPRRWPDFLEELVEWPGSKPAPAAASSPLEGLIEQDVVEYSFGLVRRVTRLVGVAFQTLHAAYVALQKFPRQSGAGGGLSQGFSSL